jgi:4'-phosphopantetheinyl transferase
MCDLALRDDCDDTGVVEVLEVFLCRVPVSTTEPLPGTGLSPEEVNRAASFRRLEDRNRFVAGRRLARRLVGSATRLSPAAVRLVVTDGRVSIEGHPQLQVSISHSGEWVACVVSDRPVGVDVEQRLAQLDPTLVRRSCTPRETAAIAAAPDSRAEFTRMWVRKEALVKAAGIGMAVPFDRLDVGDDVVALPSRPDGWRLADIEVGPGYHGAVAATGSWRTTVVTTDACGS